MGANRIDSAPLVRFLHVLYVLFRTESENVKGNNTIVVIIFRL